jgi:hypothetical protein
LFEISRPLVERKLEVSIDLKIHVLAVSAVGKHLSLVGLTFHPPITDHRFE